MLGNRKQILFPLVIETFPNEENLDDFFQKHDKKCDIDHDKATDIPVWGLKEAPIEAPFILQNKNINMKESYTEYITKYRNGITGHFKRTSEFFEPAKMDIQESHSKEWVETLQSQYMLDALESMYEFEKGEQPTQNSEYAIDYIQGCELVENKTEVEKKTEEILRNSASKETQADSCLAAGDSGLITQVFSEYEMDLERVCSSMTEKTDDGEENRSFMSFLEVPEPRFDEETMTEYLACESEQKTETYLDDVSTDHELWETLKETSSSLEYTMSDLEETWTDEILKKYAGKLVAKSPFESETTTSDDDYTTEYSSSDFTSAKDSNIQIESLSTERSPPLEHVESGLDDVSISSRTKEIFLSQHEMDGNRLEKGEKRETSENEALETKVSGENNEFIEDNHSEIKIQMTPNGCTVLKDDHNKENDVTVASINITPDGLWINKAKVWAQNDDCELATCEIKVRLLPSGGVVVQDEEVNGNGMEASIDITPKAIWLNKTKKLLARK